MTEKYYGVHEVCELKSISKATLYRWIDSGLFPKPKKLGPRRVAWTEAQLDAWDLSLTCDEKGEPA